MNERIQELADNATHYANGICDADSNADWYATRDQKFAEMIARECANIAFEHWALTHDTSAQEVILKHFDLDETVL
jgi:hypothetical protein